MTRPIYSLTVTLILALIAAPAFSQKSDSAPIFSVAPAYTRIPATTEAGRSSFITIDTQTAAFVVNETELAKIDLNADGDSYDPVVLVMELTSGRITNTGLAKDYRSPLLLKGSRVAFGVKESYQQLTDLNGDGDMLDTVVHVYDISKKTATSLGLAIFPNEEVFPSLAFDGRTLVFTVTEFGQGVVDLNGDGDTVDRVLHVYDADSGKVTNFQLAGRDPAVSGGLAAFSVDERYQAGIDLNGDGDALDGVMHLIHLETRNVINLGIAGYLPAICGSRVIFQASEVEQGKDLNGDGSISSDGVAYSYDAGSRILTREK